MCESLKQLKLFFFKKSCIIVVQVECMCANGLPSGKVKFEVNLGLFHDPHYF